MAECGFTDEDVFNYTLDLAESVEDPVMAQHVRQCPKCKRVLDGIMKVAGAAKQIKSDPPAQKKASTSEMEPMPAVIGEFKIVRQIAVGGMGKVFEAYDPFLDRTIALKVMKEELSNNAQFCERFVAEAKVLAKLNHPNIVMVH